MRIQRYAVSDQGLAVKLEEINIAKFREFIKQHKNVDWETDECNTDIEALSNLLIKDSQYYLGENWSNGVICYKWSYGNDIQGEFVPLLNDVNRIAVSVEDDEWVMMCLPRYASLFEKAYESEDALISEMKLLYGEFLPYDFNYKKRLANLCAVIWG